MKIIKNLKILRDISDFGLSYLKKKEIHVLHVGSVGFPYPLTGLRDTVKKAHD